MKEFFKSLVTNRGPKKQNDDEDEEDEESEEDESTSLMTVETDDVPNVWYTWNLSENIGPPDSVATCYLFLSPQTPYEIVQTKVMESFQLSIKYPLLPIQKAAIVKTMKWDTTEIEKYFPTRTKQIRVSFEGKSLLSSSNISQDKCILIYEIKFTEHPTTSILGADSDPWWVSKDSSKKQEE